MVNGNGMRCHEYIPPPPPPLTPGPWPLTPLLTHPTALKPSKPVVLLYLYCVYVSYHMVCDRLDTFWPAEQTPTVW